MNFFLVTVWSILLGILIGTILNINDRINRLEEVLEVKYESYNKWEEDRGYDWR